MSTEDQTRELPESVVVGRVRKPHGVRGEIAVEPDSDVEGRFAVGVELLARLQSGAVRELTIAASRPHGDVLLVRFDGVDDRDEAELLRSALLEVRRAAVPPPPEGSYYFYELIDSVCVDLTLGELGRVENVIEDGGGLLLELATSSGKLLVPFVEAYVRTVDVEAARIELDLPPGLIETCTSTS